MRVLWKELVAGASAATGVLVLAATVLTGAVGAQAPSPSPAASPAASQGAQPGSPPNRVYGTAQLNGQTAPTGTTVTALIGTSNCGTAQVTGSGTYVVDVASSASQAGCGTDGAAVSFNVGSARATQTTMWRQGAFTEVNLTAQAATATPSPRPATATPAPATPRPATATPAPPPPSRPPVTASPAPTRSPAASPTVQRPAGPPAAAQPPAQRPAPAALPRTGTGVRADTGATTSVALGGLALAVLALGATGLISYRRSR